MTIDLDDLKEAHEIELKRREEFRKHAQNNLVTITLSLTFVFGTAQIYAKATDSNETQTALSLLVRSIAIFSILSFYMSALSSMKIIGPTKIYDVWLQTLEQSYGRNSPEEDKKAKLIKIINLNQAYTLIVSNYSRSSDIGLRNGAFGVGVVLLVAMVRSGKFW